jgi:hypothetical protein
VSGLALKIEQRKNLRAGSPAALFNYFFVIMNGLVPGIEG